MWVVHYIHIQVNKLKGMAVRYYFMYVLLESYKISRKYFEYVIYIRDIERYCNWWHPFQG